MTGLWRALASVLPESRQVIVRTRGRVRQLTVPRALQLAVLAAAAATFGWTGVATWRSVDQSRVIERHGAEFAALQAANLSLARDLGALRADVTATQVRREAHVAELSELASRRRELLARLMDAGDEVAPAGPGRADPGLQQLRAELRQIDERLAAATAHTAVDDLVDGLLAARDERDRTAAALDETRSALAIRAARSERLERDLASLRRQLAAVDAERDRQARRGAALARTRDDLLARAEALTLERDATAAQLGDAAAEAALRTQTFERDLAALREQLAATGAARDSEAERRARLERTRSELLAMIDGLTRERDAATGALDAAAAARDTALAARARVERQLRGVERLLAESREALAGNAVRPSGPVDPDGDIAGRLTDIIRDRDALSAERDGLRGRVAELESLLAVLEDGQRRVVGRLHDGTAAEVARLERVLEVAGLDADRLALLVPPPGGQGVGGPLRLLDNVGDSALGGDLAVLDSDLDRLERLRAVVAALPLTVPLDNYHLASGFGRRSDPFTGRWAMHMGLDFATRRSSPVHAPAPGRVSFVGWKGAYGKMVEIDHGLGIRTRYGHLRKILVRSGQEVEFRNRIGLLGSTGRSTGPHLHYEVLVDGKQIDPAKLLRAGRHVHEE